MSLFGTSKTAMTIKWSRVPGKAGSGERLFPDLSKVRENCGLKRILEGSPRRVNNSKRESQVTIDDGCMLEYLCSGR